MHEHLKELRRRFPAIEWRIDAEGRVFWGYCEMQTITVGLHGMSWTASAWGIDRRSMKRPADAVEYLIDGAKAQASDMLEWAVSAGKDAA